LVLASTSPRRRQILEQLGFSYQTVAIEVDESPHSDEAPEALAERLAQAKARAGASLYPGSWCIGADTVVALGSAALGKPTDTGAARRMLIQLRGREHRVLSAVALARVTSSGETRVWHRLDTASVRMRDYTDQEVEVYAASGDPLDKAGAYAIQHAGFHPVERLSGCFLTVMGLPLPALCALLDDAGASRPAVTADALEAICPNCADKDRLLGP
jgi:septum formation protein